MSRTPWVGLAALIAMFVIPYLPAGFFTGPRTVKHWPRRHICAECGGSWIDGHVCMPTGEIRRTVRGELSRRGPTADPDRAADSWTVDPSDQGVASNPLVPAGGSRDLNRRRSK